MSGSSYRDSGRGAARYEVLRDSTPERREEGWRHHREVVSEAVHRIERGEVTKPPVVQRDVSEVLDCSLARNTITSPSKDAVRAVVVLVDNSGSNRVIAEKLKNSSGYLTAFLRTVDPEAEVAFVYFSDHSDRDLLFQYTDFVPPTEKGDKILFSSLANVAGANGFDEPEAIECALSEAANINFGHVGKENRTLILVTDSIPHGMGHPDDSGCPVQKSWRTAMAEVRKTFGKFVLIGSGNNSYMRDKQKKLFEKTPGVIDPVDLATNFIDLSDIPSATHRNGIVGNSILFVMARNTGKQPIQIFLASLYTKWLENPLFGLDTKRFAQTRIRAFGELYLHGILDKGEVKTMLEDIFAE